MTNTPPKCIDDAPKDVAAPSWIELGQSLEVMTKVSLALAVGFSSASIFCRLADQGKVRLPHLIDLVLGGGPSRRGTLKPRARKSQATVAPSAPKNPASS